MKRYLYIFLIVTVLFLPKSIFAQEEWVTDEEGTYYIVDGVRLTGQQEIGGKRYYFDENGIMQKGFVTINNKIYFYSRLNGVLKTGWQGSSEGQWYQKEDGEVVTNKQTIDGNKYYFNENGIMQKGFVTVNDKIYFYSRMNGILKTGWQGSSEGQWYQKEDGEVVTNKQTIDGNKYYFNENGIMQKGFVTVDDKIYFYSRVNGVLKTGWQGSSGGQWYQKEDGEVVTNKQTIDGKKYYFNENGIMQKGFVTVNDKLYFYSRVNGVLKTGLQGNNDGTWYQKEDGEVVVAEGLNSVEGKEFYFEGRYLKSGIIEIEGKKYYFDPITYVKRYGTIKNQYYEIVLDNTTGEFIRKQYYPQYFKQRDRRWNNLRYGMSTFGNTGCAPTSMAMAYSSLLGRTILPTEIADYLYYSTNEYNKKDLGTSGLGIVYASSRYNIRIEPIDSKEELRQELQKGNIVFAAMANGKFAGATWNHAIILYSYFDNKTNALDPLKEYNNGPVSIDLIWNEKSNDPDDTSGGSALYALYV